MNEILKPELIWIEGRCYRANDQTVANFNSYQEDDLYEDEMLYEENSEENDDFQITMMENSRYSSSLHVPQPYIGSLIGRKGAMKNRIEHDTKTTVKIPKQGQSGDVVIIGSTEASVKAALRRINMIVMSTRQKQKYTHFISIPINYPEIINNFNKFKEEVINACPGCNIDNSVFIKAEKLHLTIGVMALMDNEERMQASKLLAEAKDLIIRPQLSGRGPLRVRVRGLSYMNDDPSQVHVLYAHVTEDGGDIEPIQTLADALEQHFKKAGFMFQQYERDNVKLHVTLMNSKYRVEEESNDHSNRRSQKRVPFDASKILEKFGQYDFGACELKQITLSQLHTTASDGYYQNTSVVAITDC